MTLLLFTPRTPTLPDARRTERRTITSSSAHSQRMFPELDSIVHGDRPFAHSTAHCTLPGNGNEWLSWLEYEAPWKFTATDFYEQYEFSLLHVPLPPVAERLARPETLDTMRRWMARQFDQRLAERVDVTAHKLVAGQTIRIHNDYRPGGESHRLLLQLNRGWEPGYGGYLMFFGGPEPETVGKVVEPIHGSAQAFAISPRSYHAVSTVHQGERFTVVYSFYRQPRQDDRVHRQS